MRGEGSQLVSPSSSSPSNSPKSSSSSPSSSPSTISSTSLSSSFFPSRETEVKVKVGSEKWLGLREEPAVSMREKRERK